MDFKRGNVTIDGVDRERRPRLLCLDEGLNAEPGPVNASLRSLGLLIPEMKYSPILTGGWACGRIDRRCLALNVKLWSSENSQGATAQNQGRGGRPHEAEHGNKRDAV